MRRMFAVAAFAALAAQPAQAEQIWLTMDQVRPYEISRPAGQIIVGNPGIADVTVQDKTRVLLFGKGPGLTNMYILDEEGKTIDNLIIRVRTASNDLLTLHRGVQRTTYSCTTDCDATITVGDSLATFSEVNSQVQTKFSQATAAGSN